MLGKYSQVVRAIPFMFFIATCSGRAATLVTDSDCVPSSDSIIRSSRAMLCCESTVDEHSAGNRHATFCGSRGRFAAPGDPVGGASPLLGGRQTRNGGLSARSAWPVSDCHGFVVD